MNSGWKGLAGAVTVVALVTASGCGGSSKGDGATPSDKALQYESPLSKVLMAGFSEGSLDASEQKIADCMVKKGWKYTPVRRNFDVAEMQLDPFDTQNSLFDSEFRTTWGYGVVTPYGDDGKKKEGAPGPDFSQMSNTIDPNAKYVESLSDTERNQYYADLFGMDPSLSLPPMSEELGGGATATTAAGGSADPNGDSGESDLEGGSASGTGTDGTGLMDKFSTSCSGQALGLGDMDRLQELYSQLEESTSAAGLGSTEELVAKSSDLQKAQTDWAECMGRAGVEVKEISDPRDELEKEFSKLGGAGGIGAMLGSGSEDVVFPEDPSNAPTDAANPNPSIPENASAEDLAAAAEELAGSAGGSVTTAVGGAAGDSGDTSDGLDLTDLENLGGGFDPAKVDLAKIKALQAKELKTAQADYECQKAGFRAAWIKARSAAEQQVMDDNEQLIAELSKLTAGSAATTTTAKGDG